MCSLFHSNSCSATNGRFLLVLLLLEYKASFWPCRIRTMAIKFMEMIILAQTKKEAVSCSMCQSGFDHEAEQYSSGATWSVGHFKPFMWLLLHGYLLRAFSQIENNYTQHQFCFSALCFTALVLVYYSVLQYILYVRIVFRKLLGLCNSNFIGCLAIMVDRLWRKGCLLQRSCVTDVRSSQRHRCGRLSGHCKFNRPFRSSLIPRARHSQIYLVAVEKIFLHI